MKNFAPYNRTHAETELPSCSLHFLGIASSPVYLCIGEGIRICVKLKRKRALRNIHVREIHTCARLQSRSNPRGLCSRQKARSACRV